MLSTNNPNKDQETSNEDLQDAYLAMSAMCVGLTVINPPRIERLHTSIESGLQVVQRLMFRDHAAMYNKCRMYGDCFSSLCQLLIDRGHLHSTRNCTVWEQVMFFLVTVAQTQTNREIQSEFRSSAETVSRYVNEVVDALVAISDEYIRPPNYNVVPPFIQSRDPKYNKFFKNCISAIDGTHIHCIPPSRVAENYRNRKLWLSQNVLAACDFDMKFTFVLAGWEGSAHDSRILTDALCDSSKKFPKPPSGKFYVVDFGFSNTIGFLAPFRGMTYHLKDCRRNDRPKGDKELFNYTHSSLRNVIERTFGVLKARFPILKYMHGYPIKTQTEIVIACCIVHNYIRMWNEGDPLISEYNRDATPIHEIENRDPDDGINGELTSSSSQGVGYSPSQHTMAQFRDELAREMWNYYQVSPWS